ncbi:MULTISPECIES: hypothetical protein [Hoeflea]|uniref:hypothetical protein n=1 Tax=Hoeflea TaxID=274591 RepID=UPI00186A9D3B|nr:hypothetical protein [Hoeflea sp. EC-HK425]MBV6651338.1 hypothetical protein [Hoeflea sp.]
MVLDAIPNPLDGVLGYVDESQPVCLIDSVPRGDRSQHADKCDNDKNQYWLQPVEQIALFRKIFVKPAKRFVQILQVGWSCRRSVGQRMIPKAAQESAGQARCAQP